MKVLIFLFTALFMVFPLMAGVPDCRVDSEVEVFHDGRWRLAKVDEGMKEGGCSVRMDEGGLERIDPRFVRVVKKQRGVKRGISYYKGQPVLVELQGNWFPAQIIGGGGERWHIRYNTGGNMPDEWVGRERLRPR